MKSTPHVSATIASRWSKTSAELSFGSAKFPRRYQDGEYCPRRKQMNRVDLGTRLFEPKLRTFPPLTQGLVRSCSKCTRGTGTGDFLIEENICFSYLPRRDASVPSVIYLRVSFYSDNTTVGSNMICFSTILYQFTSATDSSSLCRGSFNLHLFHHEPQFTTRLHRDRLLSKKKPHF